MAAFDFTPFFEYAKQNGITLPEAAENHLTTYGNLLLEWNEKINLTAITDPEDIVIKHFTDCLSLLKIIDPKPGQSLIDVGTGAGFPGMVIKILRPDVDVTLLDGHQKRFLFLEDLQNQIGVKAINLHCRAELAAKEKLYRERYDFATARAVARLPVLAEYCLPFVKPNGFFVAMKGPEAANELNDAKKSLSILGGGEASLITEVLPKENTRAFIRVKKVKPTPEKYPRASAKISKTPL